MSASKMVSFSCQLAHGCKIEQISDFGSMKQLYQRIADAFRIPVSEILYCTLNTQETDMDCLLNGQIALRDFIYVHCKGTSKEVKLIKTDPYLGLTLTDNANGYTFIKKIKSGSLMSTVSLVQVGDIIEWINDKCVIGYRHYEVAQDLRDLPMQTSFTLRLIQPSRLALDKLHSAPDRRRKGIYVQSNEETLRIENIKNANLNHVHQPSVDLNAAEHEKESSKAAMAVKKINSLLESFLGIDDSELSNQIWLLGKLRRNPSEFMNAVNQSDLRIFGFSQDFIFDLWAAIDDVQSGRVTNATNR